MLETLANRLKNAREKINKNLTNFCQIENLNSSTISNYENGAREPSFKYLQLLAAKYHVNLHWLITGEEAEPQEIEISLDKIESVKIKFKK